MERYAQILIFFNLEMYLHFKVVLFHELYYIDNVRIAKTFRYFIRVHQLKIPVKIPSILNTIINFHDEQTLKKNK